MAHFAELDQNNKVLRVVVIDNSKLDDNGKESEVKGIAFCESLFGGGIWKQTSYNNNFRQRFAWVEGYYDSTKDVFIHPKPFKSWQLDEANEWQPPKPRPDSSLNWYWDESKLDWVEYDSLD